MATIDVVEILRSTATNPPPLKRAKTYREEENGIVHQLSTATANTEDILAALENDQTMAVNVDEAHVKKLTSQLEKKMLKNREMRVKHSDDAKKFMDSEIELDNSVQEMHVLATQPDLYGSFCDAGGPSILLALLAHENADIVSATVNLLQELTDGDILNEGEDGAIQLIDSLSKGRVVEMFVTSFEKFDESSKDEADAIHQALSVVENMIDFRPETVDDCVGQGLFQWLLKRSCQKGNFDANKMYASELSALLLQMSPIARKKLTDRDIDLLLRALSAYKRHDPSSLDEKEHMENLFNALCSALLLPQNRNKFLDGEGLQLMNLMLRERKQSRESALKVLDHACTGPEGKDNCNTFVEIFGLRTLFPLFMRTPSHAKRKDTSPDEHEEHVCAILASLFRSCTEEARERMMGKFVEHEHEKTDRTVELVLKYKEKLARFEAKRNKRHTEDSDEEDVDRKYLDRLDAGLYTLQNMSMVLADVTSHTSSARRRAQKLFGMKTKVDRISKHLLPVLAEYQANLDDEADEEKKRIEHLMGALSKAESDDRRD